MTIIMIIIIVVVVMPPFLIHFYDTYNLLHSTQREESEKEINKSEMPDQQFEKWFMDLYVSHGDVYRDFGQGILISFRYARSAAKLL